MSSQPAHSESRPSSSSVTPQVTQLSTTAIKGFALSHPPSVEIGSNGAVGDRDFFVVDDERSLISITRTGVFAPWHPHFDRDTDTLTLSHSSGQRMQDAVVDGEPIEVDFWGSRAVPAYLVEGPWSAWLSEVAGRPLSLVRAKDPGGGFDEDPVTLLSEESVASLSPGEDEPPVDARRFRMLIVFSGVAAYEEESWLHRELRVGTTLLSVGGPVPRCNATTRNPDTGKRDLKTLDLISRQRGRQPIEDGAGLNLGVYATVREPGVIRVGDHLVVS